MAAKSKEHGTGSEMQSSYRWVIVAAGALMTCVAMGAMFSLAVFLEPISKATGWSRAGISSAMTLNFLAMAVGGFGWGYLSDRIGARIVVLAGGMILGLALVLASRAESLLAFQIVYGILVGISASAFFAPMIATTTGWFDTQRSLAVSLVSVGVGVAPMTISPLVAWLVSSYDWRTAMLIVGVLSWVLIVPTAFLVRKPPQPAAPGEMEMAAGSGGGIRSASQAFRSPQFIVLALTFFACCAAHSGPIFHMVSYAIFCGIGPLAAVSIYSVEGLGGLGGRILLGVLADRLGVKPVLIAGLAVQALAIGAYIFVRELGEFYALAIVFGAAYGGVMPLYAVLAREYFGQEIMGTVLGAVTMISSIGMAAGPLVGGWLYDTYGAYTWLFVGSFAVGLGAVGIALAFPPQPSRMRLQTA
jgi:MFS family permease